MPRYASQSPGIVVRRGSSSALLAMASAGAAFGQDRKGLQTGRVASRLASVTLSVVPLRYPVLRHITSSHATLILIDHIAAGSRRTSHQRVHMHVRACAIQDIRGSLDHRHKTIHDSTIHTNYVSIRKHARYACTYVRMHACTVRPHARAHVRSYLSCDLHISAPAPESSTNFVLYPFAQQTRSTNCLGHGHGYECHSSLPA